MRWATRKGGILKPETKAMTQGIHAIEGGIFGRADGKWEAILLGEILPPLRCKKRNQTIERGKCRC